MTEVAGGGFEPMLTVYRLKAQPLGQQLADDINVTFFFYTS
jgi:hypothetical protein